MFAKNQNQKIAKMASCGLESISCSYLETKNFQLFTNISESITDAKAIRSSFIEKVSLLIK